VVHQERGALEPQRGMVYGWGWCMGDGVVHGKCGLGLGLGWDGALKGRVMYYNDMVHRVKVVQQEETSWGHCSCNGFCIMDLL
jgi:hypothetical protein